MGRDRAGVLDIPTADGDPFHSSAEAQEVGEERL